MVVHNSAHSCVEAQAERYRNSVRRLAGRAGCTGTEFLEGEARVEPVVGNDLVLEWHNNQRARLQEERVRRGRRRLAVELLDTAEECMIPVKFREELQLAARLLPLYLINSNKNQELT